MKSLAEQTPNQANGLIGSINKMKKRRLVAELYVNEWSSSPSRRLRRGLDPGILESPRPQPIGMGKMYARTRMGKYLVEVLNSASLHGLNHVVAPRRHSCERLLAVLIIVVALVCLIGVGMDSWRQYRHEATMLVLDNNFRKFEISKPSITICPIGLLDENKFPEVLKRHNITDTPSTRSFLQSLSNLTSYANIATTIDADFTSVRADIWLQLLAELRGNVEVESLYSEHSDWVSTERGLCITIASPISRDIALENWLSDGKVASSEQANDRKKSYFNINNYGVVGSIICKSHDFWMSAHYPDTVIDHASSGLLIHKTSLNTLTLEIVEVASSKSASRLSVGQRGCKLPEDGGLDMWPVYSLQMCKLECRFKRMRELCGCVPHFARPTKGIPTCTARQLLCIANHQSKVVHLESSQLKLCGCLPDCNEAIYIYKESSSFALKEGSPPDAIMNLNLDFPQVKYIRDEFFSFTDFLASIGGAGGLFLGASVLSACEIVYFASLRLLVYLVAERRKERRIKELLCGRNE